MMGEKHRWIVLVIIVSAGCLGAFEGDQSPTPDGPSSSVDIDFGADTEIVTNDSRFYLTGSVGIETKGASSTFEDLYLCLYDSEERLVEAHRIGSMESNSFRNVTVEVNQSVYYIVIDHPEFRQYDTAGNLQLGYDRQFDEYRPIVDLDVSLEYDVDEMKGGCAEVSEA